MTRELFEQIDDTVRGFVGPRLREFHSIRSAHLLKLWYKDPKIHFETQLLGPRWSPKGKWYEVGLHFEFDEHASNQAALDAVTTGLKLGRLLPRAEAGPAFGPRRSTWLRLSELLPESDDEEELGEDIAIVLSAYIRALYPVVQRLK